MRILVVNSGSSSLKLRVLDEKDRLMTSLDLPAPGGEPDTVSMRLALASFADVQAIGHRIVHGGTEFTGPVLVDEDVVARLSALSDLAPLHQPRSLAALDAVSSALPGVPAVACFDTAFHAGLMPAAATYAIPTEWRERWRLRRYGFHGLSHAYASHRTAELRGLNVEELRIITCHLGAGASLAAVRGGRSVDTTMGFTPLEGLVMATRSGSLDPGLVLWLEEHAGIPPAELAATLEHGSGLLGLAGTPDMRSVLHNAETGEPAARLALDVYLHRLRASIAAMAAAGGWTASPSPEVSARTPPRYAMVPPAGSASSEYGSTRSATPRVQKTARSACLRAASTLSWSLHARTSRSPKRCATCLGAADRSREPSHSRRPSRWPIRADSRTGEPPR